MEWHRVVWRFTLSKQNDWGKPKHQISFIGVHFSQTKKYCNIRSVEEVCVCRWPIPKFSLSISLLSHFFVNYEKTCDSPSNSISFEFLLMSEHSGHYMPQAANSNANDNFNRHLSSLKWRAHFMVVCFRFTKNNFQRSLWTEKENGKIPVRLTP